MNLNLDKVRGCFFGYAIGDALGIGTEFMTVEEARRRYPEGLRHYSQIIRDAHRSQWAQGDFTLDTEIVLLMVEAICSQGAVSQELFASMIYDRYKNAPYDFESHIRLVIGQPDFHTNPEAASRRVWENRYDAYNEALGRALILGLAPHEHTRKIVENCRVTHYDPRCVATCVVIGEAVHQYVYNNHIVTPEELCSLADKYDESTADYIKIAYDGNLEALDLDDENTYWYTRKTMAAALWAFWNAKSAEEALFTLVDAAGDADTNASLGTSLVAMKDGFKTIPAYLVDGLVQKERLEKAANEFYHLLENLK